MAFDITIEMLRRGAGVRDARSWKRVRARVAWVKAMMDKWAEAQRAMDERCGAAVERLSEEEFNRLFEAEQAKVDAIRAGSSGDRARSVAAGIVLRRDMMRTFKLNSDEAYTALCAPDAEPWIRAGSLPREPRVWEREVVRAQDVDHDQSRVRRLR